MAFIQKHVMRQFTFIVAALLQLSVWADNTPNHLQFEQALYEHLQQHYLNAISLSEVLSQKHHKTSIKQQVLLSQSYYNYNLPFTALDILKQSLKQKLSKQDKDILLFQIANNYYKHQQFEQALGFLQQIQAPIENTIKQPYHALLADIYLQLKHYKQAETQTLALQGNALFYPFAAHNLAIAYLNQNNLKKAAPWIQSINLESYPNSLQLLDSLQLAQGVVLMRQQHYALAIEHLKKISKDSPLAAKGLLALGKALIDSHKKTAGKAYLSYLSNYPEQNIYYQESLLFSAEATPNEAAIHLYQQAINQYERLLTQLQELASADLSTCLIAKTSSATCDNSLAWLQSILNTPAIKTTLQQHWQLIGIQHLLFDWSQKINAYHFILQQRTELFNKKLPKMNDSLNPATLSDLKAQLASFKNTIDNIKSNQTPFGLVNEDETDSLDDIEFIEDSLKSIPKEQSEDIKNRTAFAKGVLLWELAQSQPSRLRQASKNLKETERLLLQAQQSSAKLQQFNESGDLRLKQLSVTLKESEQRLNTLQQRVNQLIDKNKKHLSQLAQHYLNQRKQRLQRLNLRAKYQLIQLQDTQQ